MVRKLLGLEVKLTVFLLYLVAYAYKAHEYLARGTLVVGKGLDAGKEYAVHGLAACKGADFTPLVDGQGRETGVCLSGQTEADKAEK